MDAARLQAKLNSGYGKAALRLGYTYSIYRPQGATDPIVSGNLLPGTIFAAFTPRSTGFNFQISADYKQALFHGLFDATTVDIGDYLVASGHPTFFVAAKQDLLPVICVECNNTVTIVRPEESSSPGVQSYIGATPATDAAVMTSFPASLLFDARGKNSGAQLPLDEVNPYFTILMPALEGVDVRSSDIITDMDSRRYIVASSEHSAFGWRIMARLAVT